MASAGTNAGHIRQHRQERELHLLHQINERVYSSLELQEVLSNIVSLATEVTKADACFVYLVDEESGQLVLKASRDRRPNAEKEIRLRLGEGITGRVALERKIVAIPRDAPKHPHFKLFQHLPEDEFEAFLSVPIACQQKLVGVINVQHRRPHRHTVAEMAMLSTIAAHVGGAIENARLYTDVKRKAEQLDALFKVSQAIVSERYLKEILEPIVVVTAEVMRSKICSIMLLDERREELFIAATQSLSEAYRSKPNLKVGQSISGRVVLEKRPITVLNVSEEPGFMYPEVARKEGIVSLLSVPMMVKDRVIGVINSYSSEIHHYTEEEKLMLQTVANQAAIAIENFKLGEELWAAKEALEVRKLTERAKGILMKELGLREDEAYRLIQKKSMDTRKTMKDVAEAVILASEMRCNLK